MKNSEFYLVVFTFTFCVLNLLGCATVIEGAKGFAALSTKTLEENRLQAISKIFNYDYNTCKTKVEKKLTRMDSYVYARDPREKMIAIYVSQTDTTPVGIFFKEIDDNNTQIEVSSPSKYAKEFIADKIFSWLEKTEKEQEEEEKKEEGANAQK